MKDEALILEKKYLTFAALGNLIVGCAGVIIGPIASSHAILLDGIFNVTYLVTGLFTVRVATLVAGGDDERFPNGYAFFEPLVNGIKGMLVLGVSVMAMIGAVHSLFTGGREISPGIAIVYGIFASTLCWLAAYISWRGVTETQSPLVRADAENWVVNAVISSCVLIAFAGVLFLEAIGFDAAVPYVDPIVVLAVVLISIVVPVRMAWNALMALLNRAPTEAVVQQVTEIVDDSLTKLPVRERFIRVIQPGRQRMVLVHIVLPVNYRVEGLGQLDEIREQIYLALYKAHVATFADILFTADRKWGAPLSDGGFALREESPDDSSKAGDLPSSESDALAPDPRRSQSDSSGDGGGE